VLRDGVPNTLTSLAAMRIGLALPQYDYSVAGERPLRFDTIVEHARLAERGGADSVWLSDHLFLDLAKYGGSAQREGCFDPIVTLSALARAVPRVRLGTLVLLEALRPAAVLAKALATVDCVSGGRLDVGLGAGWYEPEYAELGMDMPRPGARLDRLVDALEVVKGLLGGGPFTYVGAHHSARDAVNRPAAVQQPRPRVFVGGKGDRLLRLAAQHADGWNTCWVWTPDAYAERLRVLDDACASVGRDPATMWRTLGLYALCGADERDLERRFERLREQSPPGVLDGVDLATFRVGRLVGTVDEVRDQLRAWAELGVDTLVLGVGAVPFQVSALDDVEVLLDACTNA
jgi:alkanesulfonate monooxygenase SsuD/methylene tetrahydromethanopterin reductase-like flavin-dependent oxidoreductase (luciferase family)